ncbi:nuclear transport factor 2 family protein [Mycobacteroides abscessus]|nr:nuclear transport factor 2 family protein [Mycobacteroides abscessus]MDM2424620.1 nuclear transport factor 2 family protein [Mycobacteroides abscessus]MDM2429852.1 nuclear transport factor 2 family protein [Mycobacteroides abscessus]MDM2434180.1 nuclear transport factor 2 family protein [Mycobacteroides abscessus]MDM2442781.1 nuclear transport factor 2 family protein [Mycobacteroides abscessus]
MHHHPFKDAWQARDTEKVVTAFAMNGVFHSPVGDGGFTGTASLTEFVQVVFDVTSDTEFTHEWGDSKTSALEFSMKFRGKPVRGIMMLEFDDAGKICNLWTYVRPLTGVVAVAETVGPAVVSLRSRALGKTARIGFKPLVGLAAITNILGRRTYDWINQTAGERSSS